MLLIHPAYNINEVSYRIDGVLVQHLQWMVPGINVLQLPPNAIAVQSPFIFVTGLMCMVLCIKSLVELARFPMTLDGRIHAKQGMIAISSIIVIWCVPLHRPLLVLVYSLLQRRFRLWQAGGGWY